MTQQPASASIRKRLAEQERENAHLLLVRAAALSLSDSPTTSSRTRERLAALEAENAALRAKFAKTTTKTRAALEAAKAENVKLQAAAKQTTAKTSTATLEILNRLEKENARRREALQTVDVLYLLDCTGSMKPWIQEAANKVVDVAQLISQKLIGYKIRFGFLGYRDFHDGADRFTDLPFTDNILQLKAKLEGTYAMGGGDGPEDVLGALAKVTRLPWAARTRILYHFADAPSHFKQFNDDVVDDYPLTDPDGRSHQDAEWIMNVLGELNVDYHFVQIEKRYTTKMLSAFTKLYNDRTAQRALQILDLGWNTTKFLPTIVNTITASVSRTMMREGTGEEAGSSSISEPDALLVKTINWKKASTWSDLATGRATSCNLSRSLDDFIENPLGGILHGSIEVNIRMEPFAAGALRYAFPMYEPQNKRCLVAKAFKRGSVGRDRYFEVMTIQSIALKLAYEFNKHSPPKPIDFVDVRVVEIRLPSGSAMYVTVEPFVEGDYVKHNNNTDWTNELKVTAQAYSHFTWQATGNKLMVVDLQGVGYILTDPVIHSVDTTKYGNTNLGTKGFNLFFAKHRCNFVCKRLGLNRHPLQPADEISTDTEVLHRALEAEGPREVNCTALGCARIVELTKPKKKSDPLCEVCIEKMRIKEKAVCDELGCSVTFEYQPYWYTAKGMVAPKRCTEHRGKRSIRSAKTVAI
ncbi:hypothetical protein BC937DRAFT_94097 [Endogone sp. FLAS-F59071]|nr:hypothetical protein BC937DRAFT_94097 [Endogone sp. FLAS-F59071]|eukprot:RUS14259.1 hypothetical protein BC937DRAFT_94097 [Endogone sp. FLAS-F59071]